MKQQSKQKKNFEGHYKWILIMVQYFPLTAYVTITTPLSNLCIVCTPFIVIIVIIILL